MSDKERGLYGKYKVEKTTNPDKKLDCMVMEWDDPNGRKGIRAFAEAVKKEGYLLLYVDLDEKLKKTGD